MSFHWPKELVGVRVSCREAAPALREQFLCLLRPAPSQLVLDLSLVSRVDASGLVGLVGTERRARSLGPSVSVHCDAPGRPSRGTVLDADGLVGCDQAPRVDARPVQS
jgi:hypothetical protein